ncbi:hypothetical protein [Bradyrhizobium sp. I71]|uniref:hypothetical protein n=1 Tax=Bradyrhizobium sp. I71 TaxID=2590772 RepID=UPI001EF80DBF|nr:hypothetical protein [Bradyrhizobium sp. I71]ULK99333.1 hypothetical protein FJV43_06205 [Bradyrhizobium sp. I71]
MTHPLLTALAQARLRDAPIFAKWCELNGESACPATPASVARFVADCAALGMSRLWPAVQDISRMHVSLGLADPTLGGAAASAINAIAAIPPPRSWPGLFKQRFAALPYDIQVHLASHEAQRERALRRAQNDAASARQKLAAFEAKTKDGRTNGNEAGTRDQD